MTEALVSDIDQLRRLADMPSARRAYSPLGSARFLAITSAALEDMAGAADSGRLNGFISGLPCPVIGVAPGRDNALPSAACDAVVSSQAELAGMVANIERAPLAAATLVQVLRATAAMPIAEALTVESLAYATLQSGPEFRRWLETYRPSEKPSADGPPILIERADDRLTVVLNRPANRNAFSVEMRDAVCEALELVLADPTIGTVSFSGAGRCFSVGGDLTEFGSVPDPATGHAIRAVRLPARLLAECAGRVEFRLHGACIGAGIELPVFAGRVTAKAGSFFQLPEITFGLIPGAGGSVGIPRRIGRQRTAWLALSARRISAAIALRWGLVDALAD